MNETVSCPICGAENSEDSKYCGLCLHYFGTSYSKGLVEPPEWYSASDYTMVYSESSFPAAQLTAQLKNMGLKNKRSSRKSALTNQRVNNESQGVHPNAWI